MISLKNLTTNIRGLDIQPDIIIVKTLLGHLLQFIKSLFPVTGLMPTSLRHTSHPFQFRTIQIVGTFHFGSPGLYTLLTFLQIVTVIAFILINSTIVYFHNLRTYPIQEITVVGHHQ